MIDKYACAHPRKANTVARLHVQLYAAHTPPPGLPLPIQQRAEAVLHHPSKLLYLLRPESAASRLLSSAFSCESYAVLEE